MYYCEKLDLDLDMDLGCGNNTWCLKENYESIYPVSSFTRNNNLFDDNKHLQIYIQCRIGYCCTMHNEDYFTLWRYRFWKCNHSMRTDRTVHTPNCNHCTWRIHEILISLAVQLMEIQTHTHFSSSSLKTNKITCKTKSTSFR